MNSPATSSRANRTAACAIAGTTVLVAIALAHHPVAGQQAALSERLVQIAQLGPQDAFIHGALIALLAVLASAMAVFNRAFHPHRPALTAALSTYCLGGTLLLVAMLFDGFVVPSLAGQFSTAPPLDAAFAAPLLRAIGTAIQVFSKAGLLAQCAAILIWSYAATTHGPSMTGLRPLSWLGAAAGALPALAILLADLRLAPHSLMALFAAHAVWYLAVAYLLYMKRAAADMDASQL